MDYLDRSVFMNILQYEEKLLYGQFNREIVENLINLYAMCVECYDSLKDPIKFYFLEKIQIILSHEQTLKEIVTPKNSQQQKAKAQTPQNKIVNQQPNKNIIVDNFEDEGGLNGSSDNNNPAGYCMNFSEIISAQQNREDLNTDQDDESDCQDYQQDREQDFKHHSQSVNHQSKEQRPTLQQMRLKYKQNCKMEMIELISVLIKTQSSQVKYSISKKRLERSKRVGMYLQIHQEGSASHEDTMGSLYQNFVDNNKKQANSVKQNLNQQQEEVERRLQRRKTLKEGVQNNSTLILEKQKQDLEDNEVLATLEDDNDEVDNEYNNVNTQFQQKLQLQNNKIIMSTDDNQNQIQS